MEWLDKLNKLVEENPDAQIVHMVNHEELYSDYGRTCTDLVDVELVDYIMWRDEEMLTCEDDLRDKIACDLFVSSNEFNEWSDENFEIKVDEKVAEYLKKHEWTKAIYINVG